MSRILQRMHGSPPTWDSIKPYRVSKREVMSNKEIKKQTKTFNTIATKSNKEESK